jgi:methionyl aminopeptidase
MISLTTVHGGLHADLNATYPVGKCDQESLDLIETTRKSVEEAIAICKPGVPYRDIGNKIEEIVRPKGYGIVRRYTGHGVHKLVDPCLPLRCDWLTCSSIVNLISFITEDQRLLDVWRLDRCSR